MTRKEQARANWLDEVERLVLQENPHLAGRMDWDTAIFLYHRGHTTREAMINLLHDAARQERET